MVTTARRQEKDRRVGSAFADGTKYQKVKVDMKKHSLLLAFAGMIAALLACSPFLINTPEPSPQPTANTITLPTAVIVEKEDETTPDSLSPTIGDFVGLYNQVSPGVVSIFTYTELGPPHNDNIPSGQGSGFVVDEEGYIVTNMHVVSGADQIEVDLLNGTKGWAELIGSDPDSDLAVLKVDLPREALTPLPLGDSDTVQVGEFVVAIGNPFGLSGSMTVGVVSAVGRTLDSERTAPGGAFFTAGDIIQTDAAINPGNSGGPLINLDGQVVGVNRAIRTESFTVTGDAANSGVGFAIPVNIVRQVVPSLISEGRYDYPYLGISSLSDLNLKTLETLGLPADVSGVYITCITADSPADEAGLIGAGPCGSTTSLEEGGDLIIAIDGQRVRDFSELLSYLINHTEVGQTVNFTVLRDGEEIELDLMIGPRP
jgi:S1-C subfamily serine protease